MGMSSTAPLLAPAARGRRLDVSPEAFGFLRDSGSLAADPEAFDSTIRPIPVTLRTRSSRLAVATEGSAAVAPPASFKTTIKANAATTAAVTAAFRRGTCVSAELTFSLTPRDPTSKSPLN